MSELNNSDFNEMMSASTQIAYNMGVTPLIQLEDEEGKIYDIEDVKFNPVTKAIHIKFNHDND